MTINERIERKKVLLDVKAREMAQLEKEISELEEQKEEIDVDALWDKAIKFDHPLQTSGYLMALKDFAKFGVIKLPQLEE